MNWILQRMGTSCLWPQAVMEKTVFLTTIVASLAILNDVDLLNFYILDYGNSGMMAMKELPHTAEYISIDEEERYWEI